MLNFFFLFKSDTFYLGKFSKVELLGHIIFLFLGFWVTYTACHSGWTNLHPHQQCTRAPFSPHPHQLLLFLVFLIIAILRGVRWHLIVVLSLIPWWLVMLNAFSCTFWPLVCLLWKTFWSSACFLIRLLGLFATELYEFFIYFGY